MASFRRIRWGRILIGGFLAEGSVLTFVLANSIFFAQHSFRYAAPLASILACFLFAFWVGQGVDASFALQGALVGVVAMLIQVGLTLGQLGAWPYIVAQAFSVSCGAAGGLLAGHRRKLFGSREEKQRIDVMPQKKALAFACGLLIGGFLFYRFGFDNDGHLFGWEWYQGAVLLGGIGLAGIFSESWQSAAIGLAIAPTLVYCYEVEYLHPTEGMWHVVWPLVLLFSWPVPLIGSGISSLLARTQVPRAVYFVALTSAFLIGTLFLPNIQNASRKRLETKIVPGLLKQVYDAEIVYSSHQPDRNIACDGTLLPGAAGKLWWTHGDDSPMIKNYLHVQNYNIELDCPNGTNPRSFLIRAWSTNGRIPAPRFSIDETGKLIVVPVRSKLSNTH